MANYNMDDIVEVKKREKRKKRLIKMLVFFEWIKRKMRSPTTVGTTAAISMEIIINPPS